MLIFNLDYKIIYNKVGWLLTFNLIITSGSLIILGEGEEQVDRCHEAAGVFLTFEHSVHLALNMIFNSP